MLRQENPRKLNSKFDDYGGLFNAHAHGNIFRLRLCDNQYNLNKENK